VIGNARSGKKSLVKTKSGELHCLILVFAIAANSAYRCLLDRFAREKAEYKGPWNIPKRRARKHPLAPKRPMSAFLKYSQKRRKEVKETNPEMNNTDISRLLGEMWRAADASEKEPYVESEKVERAMYNESIANWREEQAQLDAASRTSHHSVQHSAAVKKQRRETELDVSRDTALSHSASAAGSVDRRIFRPYSGSGHPIENKHYRPDHHKYPSTYHPSDSARAHNSKKDASTYHNSVPPARSYHTESTDMNSFSGPHQVAYPRHYSQHPYRQPYHPMPAQQAENRQSLPNTGSDLFDQSFYDPEPPFNPRQPRSSSHSFPDSYFFP
jgi:HMG (high mobility group) box